MLVASVSPFAMQLCNLASGGCTLNVEPLLLTRGLPVWVQHVSVDWKSMRAMSFDKYAIRLYDLRSGESSTIHSADGNEWAEQLVDSTLDAWVFKWPEL